MAVQFAVDDEYSIIPMKKIEPFDNVELDLKRSKSDPRGYSVVTEFGTGKNDSKDRTGGTLASVLFLLSQGVQIFRVHNVNEVKQGILVFEKILLD